MIITELKNIKISRECVDNPIFLNWINKQGGHSYWLFNRMNSNFTKTTNGNFYEKFVSDLENTQINFGMVDKKVQHTIKVGANVDVTDMDGIRGLFESPKILMLTNPTTWTVDGAKWQSVAIDDGTLLYFKTKTQRFDIEFDIILPMIYTQSE